MTVGELADQYLGADKNDVAAIARKNFKWIASELGKAFKDAETGILAAMEIFASFIAADGKIAQAEWLEFQYVFQLDMGEEEAKALLEQCEDKDVFNYTKDVMKAFDDEMRKNIIVFGLSVVTIDKCFSDEEADFIYDLIKIRESMM